MKEGTGIDPPAGMAAVREIIEGRYLRESNILSLLPVAVYVTDAAGTIRLFNQEAVKLWGRAPEPGETNEHFCSSLGLYRPDGSRLSYHQLPVAGCLQDGLPRNDLEIVIERPDLSRVSVKADIVPIKDEAGNLTGAITCFREITQLRQTEKELDRKRTELQDYVDNAAIGLHWVDGDGIIKWANKAELDMLGYTEEEYIGHHITEFHVDNGTITEILDRLSRKETLQQFESLLRCKDGSTRVVHISSNVLWEGEKFVHTRCFTVDVTDQKKLLDSLQEGESRYRQLIKSLSVAIYTCDPDGRIKLFNDAAVVLWGRMPVIGKDMWCGSWKMLRPDGSPLSPENGPMAIALKERRPVYGEEIIIETPDGERRNVLSYPKPIFDTCGNIAEAVNMLVDITEQRRADLALRESEERFRTAANTAPVLIWMSDAGKRRIFFNTGWLEYTGRTMQQETGDGWIEDLHPDDVAFCLETYRSSFDKRAEYRIEYRMKRKDGSYRWILSHGIPRYRPDGEFEGYIGSCIDINDRKMITEMLENEVERRTRELKEANKRLLHYNEQLEQFAYAASHDMKEPLRKIQYYNDYIFEKARGQLGDKELEYLNRSIKAAKRMQGLIDDLLSYSRATSNYQDFECIDLGSAINEIVLLHKVTFEEAHATIDAGSLPEIRAIPFQVMQLFDNLIGNALKYRSPERRLHIRIVSEKIHGSSIKEEEADPQKEYHKISVIDNGTGFEPQYADKIFELFQRLHNKVDFAGSGIGLAICKKIVHNHQGLIKAYGEVNGGAVFDIYLPVAV